MNLLLTNSLPRLQHDAELASTRDEARLVLNELEQRERFLSSTRKSRTEAAQRLLRLC